MVKALCCVRTEYQFKEKMRELDKVLNQAAKISKTNRNPSPCRRTSFRRHPVNNRRSRLPSRRPQLRPCDLSGGRRPFFDPAAHPCLSFAGNRCVLRRQRVVASHLVPCCSSLVVVACLPLHLVPCGPFYSSPACRQDWGCDMGNGKFSLCRLTQIQSVTTSMSSSSPFEYSYRCRWSLSIYLLWVASYLDSWDMDL
jgi:hypothetical protein